MKTSTSFSVMQLTAFCYTVIISKRLVLLILTSIALLFFPNVNFAQAPNLGTASGFALFTSVGAFANTGAATTVTGNVGTNVGAFNAFPPGTLVGQEYVADSVSARAATDVDNAYGFLSAVTCDSVIGVTLGNGQVLTPGVYCIGAASTINGDLILDGQGNPNALFIIKIDGALSTSTFSNVILDSSASLCNVYWQINGAFALGDSSVFIGTALVDGAISLLEGSSLSGRALSTSGAISLSDNIVTLGGQSIASIISASGPTTFCSGDSVILSGNIGGTWNNGQETPTITVDSSGDYFVINTGSCGNSDTSNHILVTLNSLPTISVAPASVCINNCAILTASGSTTYTWSPATALSATIGATVIACPEATTTYTITGANGSRCTSTTTAIVTVNLLPVIILTAITPSICIGGSDTIKASGATLYTWSPAIGLNLTTGAIVIASPTVTTTYKVIGTNGNGCVCNDTIVIEVNSNPIITLQPKSNTMCAVNGECDGHTFKILATGVNVSYQWYLNGNQIPGATDTTYSFSPGTFADTGKYVVIVSNQCGSVTSDTAIFVLINEPEITSAPDSLSVCPGSGASFCVTATGTDLNYQWQLNGANISGADTTCYTISSVTTSDTGVYDVIVSGVCGADTAYATLEVHDCTAINIPTSLETRNITCNTAFLSWVSTSALPSFTVEYRANGNSSWTTKPVTTNSIILTRLSTGTYYEWSVKGNNSEYASMADFNTSDICSETGYGSSVYDGDGEFINNFKVYPNPIFSKATITGNFEKESNIEVTITDLSGSVIMSENESVPAGDYIYQFDLSKQPSGMYFLIIRGDDQMFTTRIVKIE